MVNLMTVIEKVTQGKELTPEEKVILLSAGGEEQQTTFDVNTVGVTSTDFKNSERTREQASNSTLGTTTNT